MEISASSLIVLLHNLSEAVGAESETFSFNLLRKIFEERIPNDADVSTTALLYPEEEIHSRVVGELFPILKTEKVFVRDNEKEQILSELLDLNKNNAQLSWIPIFGVHGVGKTALAQRVYDDKMVQKHFELRVWSKFVGQEFGLLPSVARGILKSATGMSYPLNDLEEMDEMVRDTLQSHKCLIVLDEIEFLDMETWLHMKDSWFNVVGLGSKVLITTCSKEIAILVSNLIFELGELCPEAAWSLYSSMGCDYPVLHPQAIPLSIKLLGSLMRFDKKLNELLFSKQVLDIISFPLQQSVILLLSIWALPPHLIQCFAYCSIFPRVYALNKNKIIEMWIANGLVHRYPGNRNLEDIADAYFRQLICRSFFTDIIYNEYGEIVEFRMPVLIHKFAQDVARIVYKEKAGLVSLISENADQVSLALPFTKESDSKLLRTLIIPSTISLGVRLDWSLLEFNNLYSLDLSCSGIRELSDIIGALNTLKYLNLSYTLIERLPDSIANLLRLCTLNLSGCYHLRFLPKRICHLIDLRHLDLWLCDSLSYLPSGIGSLTFLKSLPLFALGKDSDCASLAELCLLNQLRGRLEIKNLEHVKSSSEAQDAELEKKDILHLGLSWSHRAYNCYDVMEFLRPHPRLKVLDLTGYMGTEFPLWMRDINSLVKISITDCGCEELPPLGHLPSLKELQLKGLANLRYIGPEFYGNDNERIFPSLEQLGIYDIPKLKLWTESLVTTSASALRWSWGFPSLKIVTIEGCSQLQRIPPLPTLPELVVWNSNSEILFSLNTIKSLLSLLIKDMKVEESFAHLNKSVKKLIVFQGKDLNNFDNYEIDNFNSLEHFGILHCQYLTKISLFHLNSLQKLNISYCQKLLIIRLLFENVSLIELVIEDCPLLSGISLGARLRKLIIKRCPSIHISPGVIEKQQELEYLLISGCPELEKQLLEDLSQISHVPCVILGNHKVER